VPGRQKTPKSAKDRPARGRVQPEPRVCPEPACGAIVVPRNTASQAPLLWRCGGCGASGERLAELQKGSGWDAELATLLLHAFWSVDGFLRLVARGHRVRDLVDPCLLDLVFPNTDKVRTAARLAEYRARWVAEASPPAPSAATPADVTRMPAGESKHAAQLSVAELDAMIDALSPEDGSELLAGVPAGTRAAWLELETQRGRARDAPSTDDKRKAQGLHWTLTRLSEKGQPPAAQNDSAALADLAKYLRDHPHLDASSLSERNALKKWLLVLKRYRPTSALALAEAMLPHASEEDHSAAHRTALEGVNKARQRAKSHRAVEQYVVAHRLLRAAGYSDVEIVKRADANPAMARGFHAEPTMARARKDVRAAEQLRENPRATRRLADALAAATAASRNIASRARRKDQSPSARKPK
jgi:hypothetical protein